MLLSPSLSALLAVLLLCGGQSLILASPMYSNFRKAHELVNYASEQAWQYLGHRDEPVPQADAGTPYSSVQRGDGSGYLPSGHGSTGGGPAPDEQMDPYVQAIVYANRHPDPSGFGALHHSPDLPPPWHSTTPSYFDGDGTPESTQRWSNQVLPAGYTQPAQLERGAPSSRNRPRQREASRSSPEPLSTQIDKEEEAIRLREKFMKLERIVVPESEDTFKLIPASNGLAKPTDPQKDWILNRVRRLAKGKLSIDWTAKNDEGTWGLSSRAKKNNALNTIRGTGDFRRPPQFQPFIYNDHLVFFAGNNQRPKVLDVFAFPINRKTLRLENVRFKTIHVGTLTFDKN